MQLRRLMMVKPGSRLAWLTVLACVFSVHNSSMAQAPTDKEEIASEEQAEIVVAPPLAEQARVKTQFSYPGGVAEIYLAKTSDVLPQVQFGINEPAIIELQDYWRVLIGIDLDTLPGEYLIYVKDVDAPAYSVKFLVRPKIYTFSEPAKNLATHSKSSNLKPFTELDFVNSNEPTLPLALPLQGYWADYFGHMAADQKATSVDQQISVQNHISLATTELASIIAPQNSIVSRIVYADGSQQLATLYLDLGRGLYSIITGIDNLTVELGDGIVAGAVIGRLPKIQGNSEPSILLWHTVLNGVYVNPLILTELK